MKIFKEFVNFVELNLIIVKNVKKMQVNVNNDLHLKFYNLIFVKSNVQVNIIMMNLEISKLYSNTINGCNIFN